MPRFDETGPAGRGPKTGRGLGPCGGRKPGTPQKGVRPGLGRGGGQERGAGRGRGRR